ncbi:Ca2+-dependent phosphoinositide-specific phospholipase C [Flavobacterium sp. LAR06]|uniref:Ca2+-dependent phosphoinositide-specific phospholipase C n=1 Tax=Flavobacterium sp. LAR06 TaxID=3064897 RepID=UPI0035C0CE00
MANLEESFYKVQMKGSHNSYEDKKPSTVQQLTFNPADPADNGCLCLEFDIWRHSSKYKPYIEIKDDYFTVSHFTPGKTKLKHYLDRMIEWHNANPNHLPVIVYLDIKSIGGGYKRFHEEIDTYLQLYFGDDKIYNPGFLMPDKRAGLYDNVRVYGWKKINTMTGKFLFCLSGNEDWKIRYSNTDPSERRCFSDCDINGTSHLGDIPNIVIFNIKAGDAMKQTFESLSYSRLIRVYGAEKKNEWEVLRALGYTVISTDKINGTDWAKMSDSSPIKIR